MDSPANWYPDPVDPALERWWDGSAWTTWTRSIHLAGPTTFAAPAVTTPQPKVHDPLWRTQKALIVLVGLSLIVAVIGGVMLIRSGFSAFTSDAVSAPTTIERDLDDGRYTLFERTGSSSAAGPVTFTENSGTSLTLDDVTVTGPDGESVVVRYPSINETITRGSAIYSGAVQFTAEQSGPYTVEVTGPAGEIMLTRTLFDGAARALVVLAFGAVVGGICASPSS